MNKNLLKTVDGGVNVVNWVQIAGFVTSAVALLTELIPESALKYVLAGVAVLSLFANTFYGNTQGFNKG